MSIPGLSQRFRDSVGETFPKALGSAGFFLLVIPLLMLAAPSAWPQDTNLQEGASFRGDHYDSAKVLANYYDSAGRGLEGWSENHRRGLEEFKRKDYPSVLRRFQPLADKGDAHASAFLAHLYRQGLGVKPDPEKAYSWAMRAAEQGIPVAQLWLGDMIGTGYGSGRTSADTDRAAAELYRAAANQGLAPAQAKLALLLSQGRGLQKNSVEAYRWALKAAERGDASAQTLLGEFHFFGSGTDRNPAQAFAWYSKAAGRSILARFMLGYLHEAGEGAVKDPARAADTDYDVAAILYGADAERAVAEAQVRLSILYWNGNGVPRDYARSAELAARAADHGSADGQWVIGLLTLNGDGVPRDPKRAAEWFRLAASQGHEAAKAKLAELERSGAVPP